MQIFNSTSKLNSDGNGQFIENVPIFIQEALHNLHRIW